MYNICLRMVSDQNDAEDVLQISFVQIFSKLSEYRFESTVGAWIKRIVVNNCINHLRKNIIHFESIEDKEVMSIEDEPAEYNVSSIKKAIDELPEGYRAIFCLYTMEGYDHSEIAQIMNISESTSKSQYSRAKSKLYQILKDNGSINHIYQ
ncbi:MAG: RNA polymerase sigma factor [Saprospiraceae bacterium]|nr:RNA polymerase sigma factor [Saprospiraceae bacterium]